MPGTTPVLPFHSDDGIRRIKLCGEILPHPGHVCAFFDSHDQKYNVLTPFFQDAIQAGDHVINIVDESNREEHVRTLLEAGVPVTRAIDNGQFRLSTSEETYLQEGLVNLDFMLEMLRDTLNAAKADGQCVRTCGEMNWVSRSKMSVENVLRYEANVNQLLPSFQCTLLCVYDMAKTPSAMVSDILATHPFAIIKGRFRENPYYVQPEEYLHMLNSRRAN